VALPLPKARALLGHLHVVAAQPSLRKIASPLPLLGYRLGLVSRVACRSRDCSACWCIPRAVKGLSAEALTACLCPANIEAVIASAPGPPYEQMLSRERKRLTSSHVVWSHLTSMLIQHTAYSYKRSWLHPCMRLALLPYIV
jgi:hypothetical protein